MQPFKYKFTAFISYESKPQSKATINANTTLAAISYLSKLEGVHKSAVKIVKSQRI